MAKLIYSCSANYGWKEMVELFLYKNYIKFKVSIEENKKWFSGGDKAVFEFENLTEKEEGLVMGFFTGIQTASERFKNA